MFIAESFDEDALNLLRKRGVFVLTPSVLFGKEAGAAIAQLIYTVANAAAAIANDPDAVFNILSRLGKVEGAALNLRGIVLELIVARLYHQKGYQIEIRKQVRTNDGKLAEIDVKAQNNREVVFIECKGKGPGNLVGVSDVNDWADEALPRIKEWASYFSTLPTQKRFQFYSATNYTEEAKVAMAKLTQSKRQPIEFLTGNDILAMLKAENDSALVNIFKEQFT